jgi:CRISPR-associated protein Csy2
VNPTQRPPAQRGVLVLRRLRVQNANAISSPLTWGFPAITAFTGMMTALERRLGRGSGMALYGVGVVCHAFEAQITNAGRTRAFHLTRHPVLQNGSTAGTVEEGRVNLEMTLVFDVRLSDAQRSESERAALAERVAHEMAGMRLAGGSVMPPLRSDTRGPARAQLDLVPDGWQTHAPAWQREQHRQWFKCMARSWLPGFVLVSRDDLLQQRLTELRASQPETSALDAWLDLSRRNSRAAAQGATVTWGSDLRPSGTVPIPVGFTALSALHAPGSVSGARDMRVPFHCVETVWSMGQWVGPHRLQQLSDVVWAPDNRRHSSLRGDPALYRCVNSYQPPATPLETATMANRNPY